MGVIFGKHSKGQRLSKIERKMVNAMKERGASGKSSLKTFNSIIMMFPKIDKTFEGVRDTFQRFEQGTSSMKGAMGCCRTAERKEDPKKCVGAAVWAAGGKIALAAEQQEVGLYGQQRGSRLYGRLSRGSCGAAPHQHYHISSTILSSYKNGNGTLELEELKDCFRELRVSFTDEEVRDLYAESDMDANSGIDFKEFIVLLALVYLLASPREKSSKSRVGLAQLEESFDRIADAFAFFDKDCDGYVSKKEIVEAIGQASPGSRNADRIGLKRFEEMDWDKNGLITFKEFLFAFTNWVSVKDEEDYSSG